MKKALSFIIFTLLITVYCSPALAAINNLERTLHVVVTDQLDPMGKADAPKFDSDEIVKLNTILNAGGFTRVVINLAKYFNETGFLTAESFDWQSNIIAPISDLISEVKTETGVTQALCGIGLALTTENIIKYNAQVSETSQIDGIFIDIEDLWKNEGITYDTALIELNGIKAVAENLLYVEVYLSTGAIDILDNSQIEAILKNCDSLYLATYTDNLNETGNWQSYFEEKESALTAYSKFDIDTYAAFSISPDKNGTIFMAPFFEHYPGSIQEAMGRAEGSFAQLYTYLFQKELKGIDYYTYTDLLKLPNFKTIFTEKSTFSSKNGILEIPVVEIDNKSTFKVDLKLDGNTFKLDIITPLD